MKRVTVVLDEQLLEEAVKISGEKTYARAIERALTGMVQRARAGSIEAFAGSGVWKRDLSEMRRDLSPRLGRRKS